jgi:hypothetical protein
MRRMRSALALAVLLPSLCLAQQETFDVLSFTAPAGWRREVKENVIIFSTVDQTTRAWSQIAVYRSTASKGTVARDVESEWQELVVKPLQAGPPRVADGPPLGGWKMKSAVGTFSFKGNEGSAMLFTFSSGTRAASVMSTSNGRQFAAETSQFMGTLSLSGSPARGAPPPPPPTVMAAPPQAASGFAFASTNFDDGWVATEVREGVLVRKADTSVLLHFLVPFTDETRNLDDQPRVLHFWNLLVSPRYTVPRVNVRSEPGYARIYFGEGDGTDAAGQRVHVTLMISSENGAARCTELVAPDAATLARQFPTSERISQMATHNKFNVGARDLPGRWSSASSAYGQYVVASTGASAGMRGVSMNDKFIFKPDGTYHFEFIGASGQVGSQQILSEKKDGVFKLGNWELTTSDSDGKTTVYSAQFEVVRGGRVLHLQNKQFSGTQFHLTRVAPE